MSKRWVKGYSGPALALVAGLGAGLLLALTPAGAQPAVGKKAALAEKKRVEVIKKVAPSVVAVMAGGPGGLRGSGSGVLIDEDGYALTNFHVTGMNPFHKCGLPDGKIYDAVLVGLDKVGDVALIKLLPKNPGDKFPYAKLGDSDKVRAGDWSLAMGNPFGLATDFTPTVTFGLVSGTNRYQYPAGTLLEYTDCIQIDTSINPGNSGGPLFNMDGELIGINGRGSFEKRGRVNSGVGYAISINQIKNFMGALRAGIDTDHATLGAAMDSESDEGGTVSRILVKGLIDSDAKRRGLETGDQLVSFAGRPMTTVNQYKNVLGLFPKGWRVPLVYRRNNEPRVEVLVRLMGVQKQEIGPGPGPKPDPKPNPKPNPKPGGKPGVKPAPESPVLKLYKGKAGYANYHFNEEAQKRVLAGLKALGNFAGTGDWVLEFTGTRFTGAGGMNDNVKGMYLIHDANGAQKITADDDGTTFELEPLNPDTKAEAFQDPPGSGGLSVALLLYRRLLTLGADGFRKEDGFAHGGVEPFYPPTNQANPNWFTVRVMAEVLNTKFASFESKWYFAIEDDKEGRWKKGQLIGFEVTTDKDKDPCEVCVSHYKDYGGRQMPSKFFVRYGGNKYADYTLSKVTMK